MYGSVYYDKRKSVIHWSEYDNEGHRTINSKKWAPDFYIETKQEETEFKSQCGKHLKRVQETAFGKRRNKIKEVKEVGLTIFGSDLSCENKFILEHWPQDITNAPPVRFMFLDIETECEDGFSDAEVAKERINLISCWSSFDEKMVTFGLEHAFNDESDFPNVKYVRCVDEKELLEKFIQYLEKMRPDIWSGWNSSGYDVPYIFNRVLRVLDGIDVDEQNRMLYEVKETEGSKDQLYSGIHEIEEKYYHVKRLSHYGSASKNVQMKKDPFTKEMKPQMVYVIDGITDYDYLELDKQFRLGKRDSYKLDSVAFDELGERKIEYDGTLKELYHNDWNKFVLYNIQDVMLLVRLNRRLNYIPQAIALSYKCHCTFKDNFGTVQKVESAVYNFLMKDNIIMQDRVSKEKDSRIVPGGFVTKVADLRRGLHKWIIDVDIASLYPSLMRGMNISYDTKVCELKFQGEGTVMEQDDDLEVFIIKDKVNGSQEKVKTTAKAVKKLLKAKKYHVSAYNAVFKNIDEDKGVLVKMLDMWYAQRKNDKKLEAVYRQKALDVFNTCKELNESEFEIEEKNCIKKVSEEDYNVYEENMRLSGVHFNLQWSCKILLNSVYGCLASDFSRFFGYAYAASITLSGQRVIRENGKMLNNYFNNEFWDMPIVKKNFPNIDHSIEAVEAQLYTDTDSVVYDTSISTNKGDRAIGELFDSYNNEDNIRLSQHGHEMILTDGLECLTYDEKNKKEIMGKVKKLVRHKVTKKKWRIRVEGKEVIMTEDHGCIVKRHDTILRVKPSNITKGDKLIKLVI